MGTLQLPHQPNGGDGHGGNGKAPFGCPRSKKPFASREEAEQFEVENRKSFPNLVKQYAYQCPDCPAFHLTSKPPDAYAMGKTNLKRLETQATGDSVTASVRSRPRGETEAQVRQLWEEGKTDSEIASELGVTYAVAYYHRKKLGAPNGRCEQTSRRRQPKPPLTLPEFDERKRLLEEKYQAELQALEMHKVRLIEGVTLTVKECNGGQGLFIKFGHQEPMVLPKDKVAELANSLMQWV